ncbi:MAG: DUF4369 domain-containing protein [Bacteroidota bacterium]
MNLTYLAGCFIRLLHLNIIRTTMVKYLPGALLTLLFLFSSCNRPAGNQARITGNLTDQAGIKLVLQEMDTREIHLVDSVTPEHGRFSFNPPVKEPGFWLLRAPSGKILVLMLAPGDNVDLAGSTTDFPDNILLKGPPETMMLHDFYRSTRVNERRVDSLEMLLIDRQDSSGYFELTQKIDLFFRQIWERQRTLETAFINAHPQSIASLIVLNYAFGMSPVLSPEEDLPYYQKLDSSLFMKSPSNKHVRYHHERVQEWLRKMRAGK